MTKLLEFFLIIFLIWFGCNVILLLWKRTHLVRKLRALRSTAKAEISYKRIPHLSLLRLSVTPEITVRAGSALYLIRLYNGGGIGKVVHFASPEFTVRFSRMKTASYSARTNKGVVFSRRGFAIGSKVIHIAGLDTSLYKAESGVKVVPVLIFNPAPGEVSFVTEEKTAIMTAFTGDEIYGTRIFTASTFVSYVERAYREELRLESERKEAERGEFVYN